MSDPTTPSQPPITPPQAPPSQNGWTEWGNHVLSELERLSEAYEGLRDDVQQVHIEVATLKVKSGVWGLMGGLIPIVIALGVAAIAYFVKNGK